MNSLFLQGQFPLFGSRSCCLWRWSRWSGQRIWFLVFRPQFFFHQVIDVLQVFLNIFQGAFRSPVALLSALVTIAALLSFLDGRSPSSSSLLGFYLGAFRSPVALLSALVAVAALLSFLDGMSPSSRLGFDLEMLEIRRFSSVLISFW